jgi:phosphotransferase system HPr (HPr) family protein
VQLRTSDYLAVFSEVVLVMEVFMSQLVLTFPHEAGLHARPLAQFVKVVKQFDAEVVVWNVTSNKGPAKGDSPLKLMLLTVKKGDEIKIEARGEQAETALEALRSLIEDNFAE